MTGILFPGNRFCFTTTLFCMIVICGIFLSSERMKKGLELKRWQKEVSGCLYELEEKNIQEIKG